MFEWDQHNVEHIARHGVDPEETEEAARDPDRASISANKKGRSGLIGMSDAGRILVVILDRKNRNTWRVVTARDASANEKKSYRKRNR